MYISFKWNQDDEVVDFEGGVRCAINRESVPYIQGMQLDYSDVSARRRCAWLRSTLSRRSCYTSA